MMVWYGHGMTSWGWFVMSLSTLLFWALVVGVGVLLFRTLTRPVPPGTGHGTWHRTLPGNDPERILAERYARGEIDDEEYHRRLTTLRGSRTDMAKPSVP